MKIRKSQLLVALMLACLCLAGAIVDSVWFNILIASFVAIMILRMAEEHSAIQLMFLLGFVVFIYAPAVINSLIFATSFQLFYISGALAIIFLVLTTGLEYRSASDDKIGYLAIFFIFSTCVVLTSFYGDYSLYFLGPLVMSFALCLKVKKILYNTSMFLIFLSVMAIYYIYGWSGYGRVVIFGYVITAFLFWCYANSIRVNKVALVLAGTAGSLALVSRKSIFTDFDLRDVLNDSTVGPYRLASDFIDHYDFTGMDFEGFVNQIIFTFFSFVPRDWWPEKPYGFGFQYVIDNMSARYVDAGHSIASTLVGDHIYYLGWFGLLSGFFIICLIAYLCRVAYNSRYFHGFVHVIFAANMMVLVWGGMTSFSARIIFPLIGIFPFVFSIAIFRQFLKRRAI